MNKIHKILINLAMLLLAVAVQAQDSPPLLLTLAPPDGFAIIPVMEGWTANEDDTVSYSFGAINRGTEAAVDIPVGERNYIEPARFNGMQPTHFPPGHIVGVFTVTVPANMTDVDIWWHLISEDGEELKVPGRSTAGAYELDFILPRPQGSLQPFAGFGENSDIASGLLASVRDYPGSVKAGSEVLLTVRVKDPSVRDSSDSRFTDPLPLSVTFNEYQGSGAATFTSHPDNVVDTPSEELKEPVSLCQGCTLQVNQSGPNVVSVPGPEGIARVYASFAEPGNYIIHAKVDNFAASDSTQNNQCCWTNVYQKITVTP